jgi:predicted DCC family thiol-disulfide oxidoreductase YuxK
VTSSPPGVAVLLYDKQCPLCDFYCRRVRVNAATGGLLLVDARTPSELLAQVTAAGLDIDQGMVLKLGEQLYYGADAIAALALISSRSGLFNRVNYWIFRSSRVSRYLYPMLRSMRNLLLNMLRKHKINNLCKNNNDRF